MSLVWSRAEQAGRQTSVVDFTAIRCLIPVVLGIRVVVLLACLLLRCCVIKCSYENCFICFLSYHAQFIVLHVIMCPSLLFIIIKRVI